MKPDPSQRGVSRPAIGSRALAPISAAMVLCLAAMLPVAGAAQQRQPSHEDTAAGKTAAVSNSAVPGPDAIHPISPAELRRQQLAADSARLLQLATELKAEIDKTPKDMLSLTVIRKADEVGKLAHKLREEMKTTASAN